MMGVINQHMRWFALLLSLEVVGALTFQNCDADTVYSLQKFMDHFVETANNELPAFVDADKLDPMNVPFTSYVDLMKIKGIKEACTVFCDFHIAKCTAVGVYVRRVTLRGLRNLRLNSWKNMKCLELSKGEKCPSCAQPTGNSREGYDIEWKLRWRDAFQVELELMPIGFAGTCKSRRRKIHNLWSGYITCTTRTSDAVISGNVCIAVCAPLSEDKVCVACKKISSMALNLSPVKCKYDRKGGVKVLPGLEKLFNKYLLPKLSKELEKKMTEKLEKVFNEYKLPVPKICPTAHKVTYETPTTAANLTHSALRVRMHPPPSTGLERTSRSAVSTTAGAQSLLYSFVQHIVDTSVTAGMNTYNWTKGGADLQDGVDEDQWAAENKEPMVLVE